MDAATRRVKALVTDIRKRWRRRALMQGAALVLLALVFCAALLALLYSAFAVPLPYLLVGAGVAVVAVLGIIAQFVLRPAFRRISDRQIALFIEEHVPELEDRLNSAVEAGGQADLQKEHGALLDKLMGDAALRARAIPVATVVDRKKERLLTLSAAAFLLLFLLFGYAERDRFLPLFSGADLSALMVRPPLLTVSPGDVEIEKGTSQEIVATLRESDGRDVTLHYKQGDGDWQKVTMQKGLGDPVFLHELRSIQEPVRYFVEYDGERTSPATISLYEFPDVDQIDLTYTYPRYVGRPPYTEEDTGDIRGLKGSTVGLDVRATGDVERAELVLDGGETISLEAAGAGRFRGRIELENPGTYSVRLVDRAGKENKFPRAYQIIPVEDEKPYITLTDPQRDVRANAVQEVLVAVTVEDDYGVKAARLKYSINGAEEETLVLAEPASATEEEVMGEHLFFLEDFSLEPGDVISYYVEAEDHARTDAPEATDMYFVEVIPFEQQYAQAAGGGMPMGGGQPSGTVLSQQQIIAATWKLHRERAEMDEAEFDETLKALVQAQANLKADIEERIGSTAFSLELRSNEANREVVDLLRQATAAMDEALKVLDKAELQAALTPERQALNHLLKADALNKERQVALNQQPGRGGGGSAQEERMTELMDLELDISKDKYEVAPQGQRGGSGSEAMDEALRKIQELARKQENLANQNRQPEIEGEDKKRRVERLEREQDELREQTEALSQTMRQQMRQQQGRQGQQSQSGQRAMREMDEGLERVAENMREAEQALRRGDEQRAQQEQQQALNELSRLEERLRMAGTEGTRQQIDELAQNFRQLQEQEEGLAQDLEEATEAQARSGQADPEAMERLAEKRQALREALDEIRQQAEAVEERTAREDPELAAAARNAVQQMRRQALEEKMESQERALEQGWLDRAGRQQEEIATSLERMEESMRTFDGGLPVTEEEQLARALDDVRALQEQLDDLQRQQAASSQEQGSQQQGQPNTDGNERAQNEGRTGGEGEQAESEAQAGSGGQGTDQDQRAQAARRQSQLERAQESLERLQQRLDGNQAAQGPLRQLQRSLNAVGRADHTGTRIEGENAGDYFSEQVYDPLSQLELELAQQLGEVEMQKKLYGARRADVPPEYRDLVERYYEALSKGDR